MSRHEEDALGTVTIDDEDLGGIHTIRARQHFTIAGRPMPAELIHAYGAVKLACARCNHRLGFGKGDDRTMAAIELACRELIDGTLDHYLAIDALQGGAGTSTNLAVCEVLCNRALQVLGHRPGAYQYLDPITDLNRHQSTNDTYPTALTVALLNALKPLERALTALQNQFQEFERSFADVVKVGRTELMDAVPTTLGRSMGAYAEAFARDRWRIMKCNERLRVVNLGGTAIGTGLGAPRAYIFAVVDHLREITGHGLSRAENLVEATQNHDQLVEVAGMITAAASNLIKIGNDLRWLASGPASGLGEIALLPWQAGSSIMPGKVNPVALEAAVQGGHAVIGDCAIATTAVAAGNLELNAFLPLLADRLLNALQVLCRSIETLSAGLVGCTALKDKALAHLTASTTAVSTALAAAVGYHTVTMLLADPSVIDGSSLLTAAVTAGVIDAAAADALLSPEAAMRLGSPTPPIEESPQC